MAVLGILDVRASLAQVLKIVSGSVTSEKCDIFFKGFLLLSKNIGLAQNSHLVFYNI
jgi:hypothetical protein